MKYFEILELPVTLALDRADLESRFYRLSRELHPDRFTRAAPTEQQAALDRSALLNDAYRALRDPVKRGRYVLEQSGLSSSEQDSKNVPPELLEEVFELNMALEELRSGDEASRPQLEEAREKFNGLLKDCDQDLEAAYREHDAAPGRPSLEKIRGILHKRKYLLNLVTEVEKTLSGAPVAAASTPGPSGETL